MTKTRLPSLQCLSPANIGASNFHSQKAMEKIGSKKIGELKVAYHDEDEKLNYIYLISKTNPARV